MEGRPMENHNHTYMVEAALADAALKEHVDKAIAALRRAAAEERVDRTAKALAEAQAEIAVLLVEVLDQ
jgi:hypothetical protein